MGLINESNNIVFTDWLLKRKISPEVLKLFGVHSVHHNTLGDCICLPVYNENGIFSFNKYRRNPLSAEKPKYLYDKGGMMELYGMHLINNKEEMGSLSTNMVLWVEGELDALVAWSFNVPAISGTGGAGSMREVWATWLKEKNLEVILCLDNDEAGGVGMSKLYNMLQQYDVPVKILFLPDRPGIKDLSDYVTNGGDVNELIKGAVSFKDEESIREDQAVRVAKWQSTFFHDAYIHHKDDNAFKPIVAKARELNGDRVIRAKNYPVDSLIKFTGAGKARCLWHSERSGSLHYFKDTNTVYCFGCGKHGDAIDVYRQLNGCGFKEAVEALQ